MKDDASVMRTGALFVAMTAVLCFVSSGSRLRGDTFTDETAWRAAVGTFAVETFEGFSAGTQLSADLTNIGIRFLQLNDGSYPSVQLRSNTGGHVRSGSQILLNDNDFSLPGRGPVRAEVLGSPLQGVGYWNTGGDDSTELKVFDSTGTLIESLIVSGFTFGGIRSATPIYSFEIDEAGGNGFFTLDDMQTSVLAVPLEVDSTADAVDAAPGDGTCATSGGDCTLRAAIQEANALAGPNTITLPAGTYVLTIPGLFESNAATGDLDITDDLTIDGAGELTTIVDGNDLDRVFEVLCCGSSVTFNDLTIQNGEPFDGCTYGDGAGLRNSGSATLNNVTVTDNHASYGAGIWTDGGETLVLNNAKVLDNTAEFEGGGIYVNFDSVTVNESTVSGNAAFQRGAGIFAYDGSVNIDNSTISVNTAGTALNNGQGGGIYFYFGSHFIQNSTISGNTLLGSGTTSGGGIYNSSAGVEIVTSTISGNSSGEGGGIYNEGSLTLASSTVASNTGGGIFDFSQLGTVYLDQSLLADNSPVNCNSGEIGAFFLTAGYNLSSDTTCNLDDVESGDLIGVNPQLGPLADNGGPTRTHALPFGSPAVDAVPAADCATSTDQRGEGRPFDGDADSVADCDIGAFELSVTFLVGDGNDDGVLDAADLVSILLEINDGDGSDVADVAGGTYPGTPALDVNGDGQVNLQDVAVLVTALFGGAG